jgi:hypothetical protein
MKLDKKSLKHNKILCLSLLFPFVLLTIIWIPLFLQEKIQRGRNVQLEQISFFILLLLFPCLFYFFYKSVLSVYYSWTTHSLILFLLNLCIITINMTTFFFFYSTTLLKCVQLLLITIFKLHSF